MQKKREAWAGLLARLDEDAALRADFVDNVEEVLEREAGLIPDDVYQLTLEAQQSSGELDGVELAAVTGGVAGPLQCPYCPHKAANAREYNTHLILFHQPSEWRFA